MLQRLVRPLSRQLDLQSSITPADFKSILAPARFFSTHDADRDEQDHEHEARAVSEHASFFGAGVAATAQHVKEKVRSAVGLENGKPISENETMGPAGHMQGRDPNTNPEEEYKALKAKSRNTWDEAGQDKPPNYQYPGHGQNS